MRKGQPSGCPFCASGPTLPRVLAMIRTLLAQRFRLVARMERRAIPVYVLTFARTDRTLGPNLRQSSAGCSAGRRGGGEPSCGLQRRRGFVAARGMTLDVILLHGLLPHLDRLVVDETGLQGEFDWTLEWGAETTLSPADGRDSPQPAALGPSIFTAIEEQLGLRLQSGRRPVDVLVIDSLERPTPD